MNVQDNTISNMIKIRDLDIDEDFYIENDIVKVTRKADDEDSADYSLDDMWNKVKEIITKAKAYHQNLENGCETSREN